MSQLNTKMFQQIATSSVDIESFRYWALYWQVGRRFGSLAAKL